MYVCSSTTFWTKFKLKTITPTTKASASLSQKEKSWLKKRQKLIKIADSTKDGWQVVNEYESDKLASGSEDKKKLKKAKDAVTRKKKSQSRARKERL